MPENYYGVLQQRNIKRVRLGHYEFDTWYGNAAYFANNHTELGYIQSNRGRLKKAEEIIPSEYWIDLLHVCEYCFKYTTNEQEMTIHTSKCQYNIEKPTIGKLVYRDDERNHYIREIRGFQTPLFCQNLSLYVKLFLDDKSVYYNVDHFNYYVIYGELMGKIVPMGYFSKEILAYENDNNLACICIFPPFQRRHLGSLLIEFSYALAKHTPGQVYSGPEFPLSPYGKITYLSFWLKLLVPIVNKLKGKFTLRDIAKVTGYRREDILLTLEYMGVLVEEGQVCLSKENFRMWCKRKGYSTYKAVINEECLLL